MRTVRTPTARATDGHASHEAAEHMDTSGKRAAQQAIAITAVAQYPGLTSLEVSRRSGICRFVLARRLPECETGGAVRRGPERRCTVSGRTAATWYPPDQPIQLELCA